MKPTSAIITVPISVVQSIPDVQQVALLANACGSQGTPIGEDVVYQAFNHHLPPAIAAQIESLSSYGVKMTGYESDVYDSHYRHMRYIAVTDLSASVPVEVPGSLVTASDESTRQLTWQEVEDLPTVASRLVDGTHYFQLGAAAGNRSISNNELAAMSSLSLLTQQELPSPPSE
tara:strand:- start:855 stop:1376 length:522 start_codon:yes stop_codon:yes gene_type:complete